MRDYAAERRCAKQVFRRAIRRGRPIKWSAARRMVATAYNVERSSKRKESKSVRRTNRATWKRDRSRIERKLAAARTDQHAKAKALASATAHRQG